MPLCSAPVSPRVENVQVFWSQVAEERWAYPEPELGKAWRVKRRIETCAMDEAERSWLGYSSRRENGEICRK